MITENEKTTMSATTTEIAHSTSESIPATIKNTEAGANRYDFISAAEISEYLEIGLTQAYGICKTVNKKLEEQGFLTFRGKIPRMALMEYLPH